MTKIHITGNSGSGKSTFANLLSTRLGMPIFGLDKIVWKSGWKQTNPKERRVKEEKIVAGDNWIIEGVCAPARREADVIVFLDVGYFTSIKRSFLRNLRYLFRSRPELPERCPEILMIFRQFSIIWKFHFIVRPKILAELSRMDKVVYIVKIC